MDTLVQAIEKISILESARFAFKPMPTEVEHAVLRLYEIFQTVGRVEREDVLSTIEFDLQRRLLGISTKFAERAINEDNILFLELGIFCHVLEDVRWDDRENIRNFIFLKYAANHLDVDLTGIFEEKLKPFASARAIQFLDGCFARSPSSDELSHFCMKAVFEDGRVSFKSIGEIPFKKPRRIQCDDG